MQIAATMGLDGYNIDVQEIVSIIVSKLKTELKEPEDKVVF